MKKHYSRRTRRRNAFTLVEALLTLSLAALAGSVMLLGSQGTLYTSGANINQTIAAGFARQLMDEILNQPYVEAGDSPYALTLGPTEWESAGPGRSRFNDIDDYHGYRAQPLEDVWGQPLGQEDDDAGLRHPGFRVHNSTFQNWSVEVRVFYVDESDPSRELQGVASNLRGIEIHVRHLAADGVTRPLANLRRVVGYVPTP